MARYKRNHQVAQRISRYLVRHGWALDLVLLVGTEGIAAALNLGVLTHLVFALATQGVALVLRHARRGRDA